MDDNVTLVLDDKYEIVASRSRLVKSCFYFQCLLAGPYRESGQSRVEIKSQGMFEFEVFENVVKFADEHIFIRDDEKLDLHFGMIELAILWAYDELIEVIEWHLMDCLNLDNCVNIHGLANHYNLKQLQDRCVQYENSLEKAMGPMRKRIGRCPLDGHEKHHYSTCSNYPDPSKRPPAEEEDWDALLPKRPFSLLTMNQKANPKTSMLNKKNKPNNGPVRGHWTKMLS